MEDRTGYDWISKLRSPCGSQEPWLPMFLAVNTLQDSAGSLWRKMFEGAQGICFRWMLIPVHDRYFLLAQRFNQLRVNWWFGLVVWDSRGTRK